MEIFFGAIFSLFVAMITAYFTARISLRKFYSEKWWGKKIEAYSEIIEILSSMQYYFGKKWDNVTTLKGVGLDEMETIRLNYESKFSSLKKIILSASFVISVESLKELKRLIDILEKIEEERLLKERGQSETSATDSCEIFSFQEQYKAIETVIKAIEENIKKELLKK